MPAALFSLFPGYQNAAQVYFGFNDQAGYLSGNKPAPAGSNLPLAKEVVRYGNFNQGLVAPFLLSAFPVRWGLMRGMVAYLDIVRIQTSGLGRTTWPYGNTTGVT
jgi:hypothetical protein